MTRDRKRLLALVAAAVLIRAAFVVSFLRHPLSAVVPQDTEAYRTLARAIAAGDFRSAVYAYLSPLYAFVLAPFATLAPPVEHAAVAAIQVLCEAGTVALIYGIAAQVFGRRAAFVAGAAYAVYGITIYYSAILLPVAVMMTATVLPIAALLFCRARPTAWWWMPGAAAGALTLIRPNAVVLFPVLAAWTIAYGRRTGVPIAMSLHRGGAMFAGLLAVLLPFSVRAVATGAGASPFPVNGGINFYIGNHAEANGMYVSVANVSDLPLQQVTTSIAEASRRAGSPLDARAASDFWVVQGLDFLRRSPGPAVRLTALKVAMLFRAEEIPLNTNYTFARAHLPLLRFTLGFGVLLPLAVAGLVAAVLDPARRRDPDVWLLLLAILSYAASTAAFFVSDRYRLPLVPLLMIFAGRGVMSVVDGLTRRTVMARWILAVAVVTAVLVNYPFASFIYPGYAKDHLELGKVYRERGQLEEAVAQYRKALDLAPDAPEPFVEIATAYYFAGRPFDAEMALRRALAVDPRLVTARRNLALLYKDQGLFDEASREAVDDAQRAAIAAARDERLPHTIDLSAFAQSQYDLGVREYGARRLGEARYAFKRAVAANPGLDGAHFALALVDKDLRLAAEACAAIEAAVALRPQDAEYLQERGTLCGPARR